MLKLYTYWRSSASYRVRIALSLKGIPYEKVAINLLQSEQQGPAYKSHNPQGLVPLLKTDEGEQISQSVAILEWLEERYPQTPLLPETPLAKAKVRSLVNQIACDIHPLDNLRVLKYLTATLGVEEEAKLGWYRHWIQEGFQALEQQVFAPYCLGEQITLADVMLIPQIYNALRFEVDMTPYPKLNAIYQHCLTQPAFAIGEPD